MKTSRSLLCVAQLIHSASGVLLPLGLLNPTVQKPLQSLSSKFNDYFSSSELDRWLEREEQIAAERLIANVSPVGTNAKAAAPGAVIASPSRGQPGQPDYYYQCV